MQMMKAAVVKAFGKPLVIEDVPVPNTGSGRNSRQGQGVRRLPYGFACGVRRLAGEADAAVHSGP